MDYSQLYSGGQPAECFTLSKKLWHPQWCQTRMEHLNYHFRQGGEHLFCYDFETLQKILSQIGFIKICYRDFDPNIDSEHRRIGTLYVNAVKLQS